MNTGIFSWMKSLVTSSQIEQGDSVKLALGPNDQRAAEYAGEQGRVTDIIQTERSQTLYGVSITGSNDVVYVEDHKVEPV